MCITHHPSYSPPYHFFGELFHTSLHLITNVESYLTLSIIVTHPSQSVREREKANFFKNITTKPQDMEIIMVGNIAAVFQTTLVVVGLFALVFPSLLITHPYTGTLVVLMFVNQRFIDFLCCATLLFPPQHLAEVIKKQQSEEIQGASQGGRGAPVIKLDYTQVCVCGKISLVLTLLH